MQQPRHVVIVVTHAEPLLDQIADHRASPHTRLVAGLYRPQFDDDAKRLALQLVQLRDRALGDRRPQPFDVVRVVPLQPAIHAPARDTGLGSDGRDLAAVDVRSHGTSSTPFGEVVLEFGLDDECVELLELRRATTRATDGLTGLGSRHDRVTMILPRSIVKRGSQAARSCLEQHKADEATIQRELGGSIGDLSKIEGLLLLKQNDAQKKEKLLNAFDLRQGDKDHTKDLVDNLNTQIADLNGQRYSLSQNKWKIQSSLQEDEILFDPKLAAELFEEANVHFPAQLKRDFEQLIAFNRAITNERTQYLSEELIEIETDLKRINAELNALGKQRSDTLSFLTGTDPFAKYKQLTDELVSVKTDIAGLERQRSFLHRLQELRTKVRTLAEEKEHLQSQIEEDVERQNADKVSLFSSIRVLFSDVIEEVIDRKALLSVAPNSNGHLEFKAEILDGAGNATSADLGHTYRKLLCIAFDMAVLRAHLKGKFARFVFHDGVFESLDDRKKTNLLETIRASTNLGIQHIITLIDSDMPPSYADGTATFTNDEIVLRLHDEDQGGRLFKMRTW